VKDFLQRLSTNRLGMCHIRRRLFNRLHIWRTYYDGRNDGGGGTAFVDPPEPLLNDLFLLVSGPILSGMVWFDSV